MFKTNQIVLYGSNGVCKITEITKKEIQGNTIEYYVLKPMFSNTSTLFVPTKNKELVNKMRYMVSIDEINNILSDVSKEENEWIEDKNERFTACKKIIASGDCAKLVKMIRSIHIHEEKQNKKGKRLNISDERVLKEAEKMVCDEFSVVLKIDRDKVMSLVLK